MAEEPNADGMCYDLASDAELRLGSSLCRVVANFHPIGADALPYMAHSSVGAYLHHNSAKN